MSLCDRCAVPGNCCRHVSLNSGQPRHAETPLEVLAWAAAHIQRCGDGIYDLSLPFQPLFKKRDGGWVMWCPNLTPEGRCGDYEGRPFACRDYDPLTDRLCWHFDETTAVGA
jgi:Fe-S-cluster containining protein